MNSNHIVESKVKCPKCGNKSDFTLVEVWTDHTISWEVIDGKFDRNDGNLEMGDAYKVQSTCSKCGHAWTNRGAQQIDDVVK